MRTVIAFFLLSLFAACPSFSFDDKDSPKDDTAKNTTKKAKKAKKSKKQHTETDDTKK